jgi:hypothetical protein
VAVDGVVDGVSHVHHLLAVAGWGAEGAWVVRLGCVLGHDDSTSLAEHVSERLVQLLERPPEQMFCQVRQQRLSCGALERLSWVFLSFTHWSTGRQASSLNVISARAKRYHPPQSAYSRIGQPWDKHECVRTRPWDVHDCVRTRPWDVHDCIITQPCGMHERVRTQPYGVHECVRTQPCGVHECVRTQPYGVHGRACEQ